MKCVMNKRPMDDISGSIIFSSKPGRIDIGRGRLIIFPAELRWKDVLPPTELPVQLGC